MVIEKAQIMRNAGSRGNLTENAGAVILSVALTVPAGFCAAYALVFQTYVLRLEVILISIQCVYIALQSIFAIVAVATFAR